MAEQKFTETSPPSGADDNASVDPGRYHPHARFDDSGDVGGTGDDVFRPSCRDELRLAISLAVRAGRNMIPHLSSVGTAAGAESAAALGIQTKSNASDFATQVDVANEELITRAISSAFPSHRIIGEETVGSGPLPPLVRRDADGPDAPSHVWIVDPVDGTTNFAAGIPLTCVSVGMVDGRTLVPAMGVAYSPATDE